jgi:hypothetical protein
MQSFLLQDWVTIRSASSLTIVTQSEDCWLDLSGFQDVVAWLEVKNFTSSGATVQLAYQSAATKDEAFFLALASALSIAQGLTITTVRKDTTATPLARWLRWQLSVSGSPTATWDATFRIFIAANAIGSKRAAATGPAFGSGPSTPLHLT